MSARKFAQVWIQVALRAWNTCIAFVCLNLVLFVLYAAKDAYHAYHYNPILDYYPAQASQLINLYPSMSKQQVSDLINETWSRSVMYKPFIDFAEQPYKGKYVNVSLDGYRLGKDQGPWPPRRDRNYVVFLFGGSTAFGYGVADDQTAGSVLQEMLRNKLRRDVKVYNFGQGAFYSTQERILFEKLMSAGHVPDLAIFLDGINEFVLARRDLMFVPQLKDCEKASCVGELLRTSVRLLPMARLARRIHTAIAPAAVAAIPEADYRRRDVLDSVIDRYLKNKLMIQAIASAFSSKVSFVWQPTPHYRYDLKYHLFRNTLGGEYRFSVYGYPLMKEVVEQHRADPIIWCADIQEGMHEPLYVDGYHYSPKMIRLVSDCMMKGIEVPPAAKPAIVQ